jgi:hypothetical protein
MAKSLDDSEKKPGRAIIGETPDKELIIKEDDTGKTYVYMPVDKAEQLEKLRKEKERAEKEGTGKGNIMVDENTTKLESKVAKLEAKLANDERAKYDKFLEGLAQKVDNVCTEVGGCRKDIGELRGRIDKDKERVEKDSKETCVGLDCLKKELKSGQEKLNKLDKFDKFDSSKLEKLDKLDRLELYDCPECNEKTVPFFPRPANYCPNCGKPAQWLEDDGKTPLKGWKSVWKK